MGSNVECRCCGYLVFAEPPGSYDICPICFWEDDVSQLRFPMMGRGANKPCLLEAQHNFLAFGASEQRLLQYVRPPSSADHREASGRPLDPKADNPEMPISGTEYGETYPRDLCSLYYWRSTYWRDSRSNSTT
jgi:hypothetical protein